MKVHAHWVVKNAPAPPQGSAHAIALLPSSLPWGLGLSAAGGVGVGPRWWVTLGPGWSGDPVGQLSVGVGTVGRWAGPGLGSLQRESREIYNRCPSRSLHFEGISLASVGRGEERLAEGGGAQRWLECSGGLERSEGCRGQTGGLCSPLWPGWAAQDLQLPQPPHSAASRNLAPHTPAAETWSCGLPVPAFFSERSPCLQFRPERGAVQGEPLLPTPHDAAGGKQSSLWCRPPGPQGLLLVSGWMALLSL